MPGRCTRVAVAAAALVALPVACVQVATSPAAIAASTRPMQPRGLDAYVVDGTGAITPLFTPGLAENPVGVGSDPTSVAFTPNGNEAYVVDTGDNAVTPISIDGPVSTAGAEIRVGHDPIAIAITPNGRTALVADHNSPYGVTPINLLTNAPGHRIKVGMSPEEIAITPNGKYAYVTNVNSDSVSVIQFKATPTVVKTIGVGFAPEAVAVTPNGKYVLVGNNGSGTVTRIAVATNKAGKPVRVGRFPAAIAITPNSKYAYVTNNASGTVSQVLIARDRVVRTIKTGGFPDSVVVTPNGKYAFVASFTEQGDDWARDHTVTAITVSTGATHQIGVGKGPIALAATLDSSLVYVANYSSGTVSPIDVATATAGAAITLDGQKDPVFIAIRP
jgi:YVTN family beta-propeller protein